MIRSNQLFLNRVFASSIAMVFHLECIRMRKPQFARRGLFQENYNLDSFNSSFDRTDHLSKDIIFIICPLITNLLYHISSVPGFYSNKQFEENIGHKILLFSHWLKGLSCPGKDCVIPSRKLK